MKCKGPCNWFTEEDFTAAEIKRQNKLAVAVIKDHRLLCKFCGEESDNTDYKAWMLELEAKNARKDK